MENNPLLFEEEYVTQQLLSASIVEAAQVRFNIPKQQTKSFQNALVFLEQIL